ncbi:type II toxin-antitoxin system PemK/MazF family toxin [Candidatus Sumerlaeota bacterium]|nr:type II toxin-antitoxin system PemK/MazF family toxin [Candidatus Sumerlaeota bacterium]
MTAYFPNKGDFVVLDFDPQTGHEQKGRRPAIVVSNTIFNKHTGMAIVCPVTSTFRNIPFHVKIPKGLKIDGFIMVEQIKSVDFVSRNIKLIQIAPRSLLNEVLAILDACIY